MTSNTLIEAKELSVRYGDFIAVDRLSLAIAQGELYALLGTNGAGKTSTLETLQGHRGPSSLGVS